MNKYQEALNKIIKSNCPNCPDENGCLNCSIKNCCNAIAKQWVNALQELIDKETPKKVVIKISKKPGWDPRNFYCPSCSRKLRRDRSYHYCPRCGQHLDWSDK